MKRGFNDNHIKKIKKIKYNTKKHHKTKTIIWTRFNITPTFKADLRLKKKSLQIQISTEQQSGQRISRQTRQSASLQYFREQQADPLLLSLH